MKVVRLRRPVSKMTLVEADDDEGQWRAMISRVACVS